MVEFILIPPDQKWDKKVIKLANEYNDLVRKWQLKNDKKAEEKIRDFIIKIEDSMIKETNDKIKKDHAFMIQLIEERHQGMDLFTPEALVLEEHMLGVAQTTRNSRSRRWARPKQLPRLNSHLISKAST